MTTPILDCRSHSAIRISPSTPHRLQSPSFDIPSSLQAHLETAAQHIRAGDTVAFPTETVYGLGAHSLDPEATAKVYKIKNRPADNPLIIHVSSLDMLQRLLPAGYALSKLYLALIDAFWPGPLTLLFPSPDPPPLPAPQTNAIRMPDHPLALALIHTADRPISAPSANSSGRPSPTRAQHVWNDLNGSSGLGCILDGGDCGVGVESTVVNGLGWTPGGGGSVDILRPGGLGVEEIERIVRQVDGGEGTEILLHGKPWQRNAVASSSRLPAVKQDIPPSTPGMKYRHYSPRVPVYLLLPSNTFPRPSTASHDHTPAKVIERIRSGVTRNGKRPKLGLLHYEDSPLSWLASEEVTSLSLGPDALSAAQRLFSGMLTMEENQVDAILIEGCSNDGLGLAVMERVSKAVGGGGKSGELGNGEGTGDSGRYWVQV